MRNINPRVQPPSRPGRRPDGSGELPSIFRFPFESRTAVIYNGHQQRIKPTDRTDHDQSGCDWRGTRVRVCLMPKMFAFLQKCYLEQAIDENKWYLSEAAGRDVGSLVAEIDFHEIHLPRVAAKFRSHHCTGMCPAKDQCELAPLVPLLNESWAKPQET